MAEVYKQVHGMPIQKWLAHFDPVQDALDRTVAPMEHKARNLLAQHRDEDHAYIETVSEGYVDRYLVLNDERGMAAAMSIEYGRSAGPGPGGMQHPGSNGTWILHDATGARTPTTSPRSRRRKSLISNRKWRRARRRVRRR